MVCLVAGPVPEAGIYVAASGALLFAYVNFYAKYTVWSGDTAWGDRYVATAAQLAALLAVPLLLRHRADVGKAVWRAGLAIVLVSVVTQLGSVACLVPVGEISDGDTQLADLRGVAALEEHRGLCLGQNECLGPYE